MYICIHNTIMMRRRPEVFLLGEKRKGQWLKDVWERVVELNCSEESSQDSSVGPYDTAGNRPKPAGTIPNKAQAQLGGSNQLLI